jgi:hypothetical protein
MQRDYVEPWSLAFFVEELIRVLNFQDKILSSPAQRINGRNLHESEFFMH